VLVHIRISKVLHRIALRAHGGFTAPSVSIELKTMAQATTSRAHGVAIAIRALVLAGLCYVAVPLAAPATAQLPRLESQKADLVVVRKSKRILQLMRDGRPFKTYQIALGSQPEGPKRRAGDGRTPEGVYTLDWRNPNSNFYRAIHVSYPAPHDEEPARRWGVPAGGLIMIHGLPNGVPAHRVGHPWNNWTNGCIAVTNREMDEIWALVDDGTTIIIYP
jgi:murein L,D-transpeptidase YafK